MNDTKNSELIYRFSFLSAEDDLLVSYSLKNKQGKSSCVHVSSFCDPNRAQQGEPNQIGMHSLLGAVSIFQVTIELHGCL